MVTKKNGSRSVNKEAVKDELTELSIKRAGNVIAVPEDADLDDVIEALSRKREEEEETITLSFNYELTVPEGCLALHRSLQDVFGFVSPAATPGFFGSTPPAFINIAISETEEVSIPWGRFSLPGVDGHVYTGFAIRDGLPYFQLSASVRGKHRSLIEKVNDAIKSRTDSIYRGQAVMLKYVDADEIQNIADLFPRFMKLGTHEKSDLILSDVVQQSVETCLFTPIEHAQSCRDNGIPLKRGILLEGPYGVGKTLTAAVTANLAKKHGWTFIYVDSAQGLRQAYEFAKNHQPAVISCEDVDEVLSGDRDDEINEILNSVDGIDSKDIEVILVLTTNDVSSITQAFLRPGRIDTVVPVRAPDAKAAERLLRKYAGPLLESSSDLSEAARLLDGKNAAMIREVVERSKLHSISRRVGDGALSVNGEDLAAAARGVEEHYRLLEEHVMDVRSENEKAAQVLVDGLKEVLGEGFGPFLAGLLGPQGRPEKAPLSSRNGHVSVPAIPAE